MARLTEQQSEQIRRERTEQILKAALTVFAEYGINGAKMSMIAEAAGVSHGLLYHYFKSKEEVLNASIAWAMAGSNELIEELRAMDASPIELVERFTMIALSRGNQDVFRIIQRFVRNPDVEPLTRELIEQAGQRYVDLLVPLFHAGQAAGQIIQEDPGRLAGHFLTVLSGLLADDLEWFRSDLEWNVGILLRMIKV